MGLRRCAARKAGTQAWLFSQNASRRSGGRRQATLRQRNSICGSPMYEGLSPTPFAGSVTAPRDNNSAPQELP